MTLKKTSLQISFYIFRYDAPNHFDLCLIMTPKALECMPLCKDSSGLAFTPFWGIGLDLWVEAFPSEAARQAHSTHKPGLRLRALHYLKQSSSNPNPAALSVRRHDGRKNDHQWKSCIKYITPPHFHFQHEIRTTHCS